MKIAIIFLCLSAASLIDITKGIGQMKSLDQSQAEYYSRAAFELAGKMNSLKTCPDNEKATRKLCIIEDLVMMVKMIASDTGSQVQEICNLLGMPAEAIVLIVNGSLKEACQLLTQLNIDGLLNPVVRLLEGLLANLGVVLKEKIALLINTVGGVSGLLNSLQLEDTLAGILTLLSSSGLGKILSSVTGVLNGPLSVLSGPMNILNGLGR
ncbi:uncharacterized protein [Eleutherodactylus coqui]|uniref:uncharacterized protein n=1 Tax=Eleutherodactylus coqui TaxID=57060 RepID=UPI0034636863